MKPVDPELMQEAQKRVESLKGLKSMTVRNFRRGLKPHEEVFCREYVTGSDLATCARAAGYDGPNPEGRARQWLSRPIIKERLAAMRKKDEIRAQFSRDIYLEMLKETYQKAMADGDYTGANKAAELLGKALGYFVDQKAVLNVSTRIPEDSAARVAEVQRLAKIAGVKLE